MLLVELALLVKLFHLMVILRNDEILMQHNTLHVPNRAIRMSTFHQHPKKKNNQIEIILHRSILLTNIDTIPTLLAILKAVSKRFFYKNIKQK